MNIKTKNTHTNKAKISWPVVSCFYHEANKHQCVPNHQGPPFKIVVVCFQDLFCSLSVAPSMLLQKKAHPTTKRRPKVFLFRCKILKPSVFLCDERSCNVRPSLLAAAASSAQQPNFFHIEIILETPSALDIKMQQQQHLFLLCGKKTPTNYKEELYWEKEKWKQIFHQF